MSAAGGLQLELRPPKRGWLPFRLTLGGSTVEETASAVLNDPLASLFDLASSVAGSAPLPARACLWLEPDGYALDAEAGRDGFVSLRLLYDSPGAPPMGDGQAMKLCAEAVLAKEAALEALISGLAGLLRDPGADALNRWHDGESVATYQARLDKLHASLR